MKKGFTLIELLVVVLIVGILSAIAFPQYQRAVAKSQSTQALTMLQSLQQAYKVNHLATGDWATSLDDLDVSIPWTGTTKWRTDFISTRSTTDWSVQLQFISSNTPVIYVGRLTGPYAGTGFAYFLGEWGSPGSYLYVPANTLTCVENREGVNGIAFTKTQGEFCRMMGSTKVIQSGAYTSYYDMP